MVSTRSLKIGPNPMGRFSTRSRVGLYSYANPVLPDGTGMIVLSERISLLIASAITLPRPPPKFPIAKRGLPNVGATESVFPKRVGEESAASSSSCGGNPEVEVKAGFCTVRKKGLEPPNSSFRSALFKLRADADPQEQIRKSTQPMLVSVFFMPVCLNSRPVVTLYHYQSSCV